MKRKIIDGEMKDGVLHIEYEDGGFAMLQVDRIISERDALKKAVEFYANHNHWMSIAENGDASNLVAHGKNFDGTSNGWVEAEAALKVGK